MLCLVVILLTGCASMDFRLDEVRLDRSYGSTTARVALADMSFFPGEPSEAYAQKVTGNPKAKYTVLAQLIVQEEPTVIIAHTADEMIEYLCKQAWEKGADGVIHLQVSTTNVAGGYARTSPVVKGDAIRFAE